MMMLAAVAGNRRIDPDQRIFIDADAVGML